MDEDSFDVHKLITTRMNDIMPPSVRFYHVKGVRVSMAEHYHDMINEAHSLKMKKVPLMTDPKTFTIVPYKKIYYGGEMYYDYRTDLYYQRIRGRWQACSSLSQFRPH